MKKGYTYNKKHELFQSIIWDNVLKKNIPIRSFSISKYGRAKAEMMSELTYLIERQKRNAEDNKQVIYRINELNEKLRRHNEKT